jgi:hypothetical protein
MPVGDAEAVKVYFFPSQRDPVGDTTDTETDSDTITHIVNF